jgi:transcriptional repressor NrdR
MRCPFCSQNDTRVVDSRVTEDGLQIRRRRECPACNARFSTYETAEIKLPQIVKRGGLARAFEKRAVSVDDIDRVIDVVVRKLRTSGEREIPAGKMGEWVMEELKRIDQVAYVRFASVYRRFEDVQAFREEVEKLEKELPGLSAQQLPLLDLPLAPPPKKG